LAGGSVLPLPGLARSLVSGFPGPPAAGSGVSKSQRSAHRGMSAGVSVEGARRISVRRLSGGLLCWSGVGSVLLFWGAGLRCPVEGEAGGGASLTSVWGPATWLPASDRGPAVGCWRL